LPLKTYLVMSAVAIVLGAAGGLLAMRSVSPHSDMAGAALAGVIALVVGGLLLQAAAGSLLAWLVGRSAWGRTFFLAYVALAVAGAALVYLPRYFERIDADARSNWRFVVTRDLAELLRRRNWPRDPDWEKKFRKAVEMGAKADYFSLQELGDGDLEELGLLLDSRALDVNRVYRANCNGMPCATTPLAHMSESLQLEAVKFLLQRGADPRLRYEDGRQTDALLGAVSMYRDGQYEQKRLAIVDALMAAGADPTLARAWIQELLWDPDRSYGPDRAKAAAALDRTLLEHLTR